MPNKNVRITAWYEKIPYRVTVNGGTADEVFYVVDETVAIEASGYDDSLFVKWTSSDKTVVFANAKAEVTTFKMPPNEVTITAVYAPDVTEDLYNSAVRFTWEKAEEPNILFIAANDQDVKFWYETYFLDADYVEEDATDIPIHKGSPDVPENIYSKTLYPEIGSSPYKSKYFAISVANDADSTEAGKYTAVCSVEDFNFPTLDDDGNITGYNIADIVANYDVWPHDEIGENVFIEIAFDVGTFLANEGSPWFRDAYDNPQTDPRLEKAKVKKLVKKLQKGSVTYYILHRAPKKK